MDLLIVWQLTVKDSSCVLEVVQILKVTTHIKFEGDKGDVSLIQMSSSLGEVTKVEKVTVSTMLERETRREKILSALNKEARLKSKAKSKMKMMMDSGMLKRVGEEEKNTANKAAEDKFFEALKAQKDERLKIGKPLIFNDDE